MADTKITQIFIKLNNKTLTLQIPPQITNPIDSIKHQIQTLTQIPTSLQTLIFNGKLLNSTATTTTALPNLATLTLTVPLHGGKGGFGSLLRGAATKAGQKKTNNFDACRDMSGRRLRHVNAEKKLEAWREEEEERKLEKIAEKHLKEMAKKHGQVGKREEKVEKYVAKYREESARCVEEVERSVREAAASIMAGGKKRKAFEKKKSSCDDDAGVDAKKLKIWKGKRKVDESDSDDSDDETDSDDSDTENEKSVIIDNGSQSDSSKDGTTDSVSASMLGGDQVGQVSSDSGSVEEKFPVAGGSEASLSGGSGECNEDSPSKTSSESEEVVAEQSVPPEVTPATAQMVTDDLPSTSTVTVPDDAQLTATDTEVHRDLSCKPASLEDGIPVSSNASEVVQPLNFDDFNSASELEVLGMDRLKVELQERGLKCGGTLQERAARLFLLKTTSLEKLPKKLFAKK